MFRKPYFIRTQNSQDNDIKKSVESVSEKKTKAVEGDLNISCHEPLYLKNE